MHNSVVVCRIHPSASSKYFPCLWQRDFRTLVGGVRLLFPAWVVCRAPPHLVFSVARTREQLVYPNMCRTHGIHSRLPPCVHPTGSRPLRRCRAR